MAFFANQDLMVISFLNCTPVQMSRDALAGLGPGLRALTVRGNQLEELPDLSPLTGLEVVDLQDNPLMCDCPLLPLRRSVQSFSGRSVFAFYYTAGSHSWS